MGSVRAIGKQYLPKQPYPKFPTIPVSGERFFQSPHFCQPHLKWVQVVIKYGIIIQSKKKNLQYNVHVIERQYWAIASVRGLRVGGKEVELTTLGIF